MNRLNRYVRDGSVLGLLPNPLTRVYLDPPPPRADPPKPPPAGGPTPGPHTAPPRAKA